MNEYKKYYGRLSSFVHNDLANIYIFSYSKPRNNEEAHKINNCGHYVTRYNNIAEEVVDIMWQMTRVFRHLLDNNKYKDLMHQILGDDTNEFLRYAKNECYFADYYYLSLHNLKND